MAVWVLRACGHKVGPACRIGFSLLWVDKLLLQGNIRIGHGNLISCRRLCIGRNGYIGRMNMVHGPLSILLRDTGSIGNSNKIVRGPRHIVAPGPAMLLIGRLGKITANHRLDCTRSVRIGDYSTLAGTGSQIWTHGYVHDETGAGRYRVDGSVRIGDNVYIGSACIVTTGVRIAKGVIVGAGATVSSSLTDPGMYVSTGLRRLNRPPNPDLRTDLQPVVDARLCERVYLKQVAR